jgi:hypothetical protein
MKRTTIDNRRNHCAIGTLIGMMNVMLHFITVIHRSPLAYYVCGMWDAFLLKPALLLNFSIFAFLRQLNFFYVSSPENCLELDLSEDEK